MTQDAGKLIIRGPSGSSRTLSLSASVLTIGRTPDNDLSLPDSVVSRRHAEIRLQAQGVVLTDLGSRNGTFIGDARLLPNQPHVLLNGTEVRIGPFTLTYLAVEQPTASKDDPVPDQKPDKSDRGPEPAPGPPAVLDASSQTLPPPADKLSRETIKPPPLAKKIVDLPTNGSTPARPLVLSRNRFPLALLGEGVSRYLDDLPVIFQDNNFLGRYLLIFETIWEPLEQRQDHISMYFDPLTCPAPFLSWLASWLGLALNAHWPEARCRLLLSEATDLYRWRGTRYGLTRMIEVCTGLTPVITDASSQGEGKPLPPFVFRIQLTIPPDSNIDPEFIEELVRLHKPAHAGYILEFS